MQCNQCGSDNTQRLQMVYEGGTANINTTSHTGGIGAGKGGLGVGVATTTTSGVSRSLLAERAAPPGKAGYLFKLFFAFLAFLLYVSTEWFSIWKILAFSVLALCAYLIFMGYRFNSKEWPVLFKRWQQKWICNKCGHIFEAGSE